MLLVICEIFYIFVMIEVLKLERCKYEKKIIGLLLTTLIVTGCGKIPELKDGKQVVSEIGGTTISADDLYKELKGRYARDVLIEMIDDIILNEKYKTDEDINKYVDSQVEYVKKQTGDQFMKQLLVWVNTEEKI